MLIFNKFWTYFSGLINSSAPIIIFFSNFCLLILLISLKDIPPHINKQNLFISNPPDYYPKGEKDSSPKISGSKLFAIVRPSKMFITGGSNNSLYYKKCT